MAEQPEPLGPILAACVFGFGGVAAFLAGYIWLGWIGMGGFVLIVIWMILTQPAQKRPAKGDGGSVGLWGGDGNSGGGCGDGGGGGA